MRFRFPSVLCFSVFLFVLAGMTPTANAAGKSAPVHANVSAPAAKTVAVPPGWPKVLTIPRFKVRAQV